MTTNRTFDQAPTRPRAARAAADPRRWVGLAVIAVAQLMVALDASIATIALPSIQQTLSIPTAERQWVVTAYTLSFGGLLLLGGRIADYLGRKRTFVIGLLGFAAASALGGVAATAGVLFAARGLQGAFAAAMTPAALSMITVTFTEARERARAFGVYGAIAGAGLAIGMVLGGALTEYASWRWCLLINVPIAIGAALAGALILRESRSEDAPRYDVPGAIAVTGGLVALVYGLTEAGTHGWTATATLGLLGAGSVLLAAFVLLQLRSDRPLLPMRVVVDRNRGGALLGSFLSSIGMLGAFLFLTFYLQETLHYSALTAGFAFLPVSAGFVAAAGLAATVVPRVGPRVTMLVGFLIAAVGVLWLSGIGLDSSFVGRVLPGELGISIGLGLAMVPVSSTALHGVNPSDAGVASAALNTIQQVGGTIGTALLNTLFATVVGAYLTTHRGAVSAARIHGYSVGFMWTAACLAIAGAASAALVAVRKGELAAQ